MKVQTPYVVLSLSEEGIRNFLYEISSSRNLFSVAKQFKDVFLFDSVSNRSFVSLNQKFGSNSGGMIELKLIDVPGDFEKRFFKSGLDQLIRIAENTELDSTIERQNQSLGQATQTAIDLITEPEELITEQINYAKKVRNNFSASVIYIAYGFGKNKEYWNGPTQVQLVDASLDIGSSKLITLKLQPVLKQLSTTNLANTLFKKYSMPDTRGMSIVFEGVSDLIDMSKFTKNKFTFEGRQFYNSSFLKKTAKIDEPGPGNLSKIDLHLLICDTIRSYLKKVCETDRVIVLLPNLNVILSDLVNSFNDTNYYPGGEVAFLETLEKVLKTLGMSLKLESSERSPSITAFGQVAIIGEMTAKEESKNPIEAFENHFKKWKRKASIRYEVTKDSMVDFKKPLFDLFNKVYQESGGKCTQPYIYYENSLDVIDLWTKDELTQQQPIFSNLPKESNKSVVVFGDKGLITSFLLGQLNLENKKNNASVADIPLHPLDSQILTNKRYNSSIRVKNKLIITKDDPNFNSLYDSSFDDFSVAKSNISSDSQLYKEFTKNFKNFISNNLLPVFRYNVKNPNTKRLSHKFSPAYFSQLVMRPNRDVANTIANTFVAKFITDYIGFGVVREDTLADYIVQRQLLDNSLSLEEIGDELISNINKNNKSSTILQENLPILISQVIDYIKSSGYDRAPQLVVPQGVPITKEKLMHDFYTEMYSKTNIISVETLPFFHLNSAHILSGCFVFADIPQPTKSGNSARTNYNQFISGYYRIVGFEHEISSNSCKSTFSLVKSLEMTNLDENDQDLNQDSFDLVSDPSVPDVVAPGGYITQFE